ncbi:MAG: pectate lyase [Myxococcota bacterium]
MSFHPRQLGLFGKIVCFALSAAACSSDVGQSSETGGAGNTTGGTLHNGGTAGKSSGGANSAGGVSASGGAGATTGGSTSTGGVSSGGASSGGASSGGASSGGASSGGVSSGGVSSGGVSSGGAVSGGGTSTSGGSIAMGGANVGGGVSGVGGSTARGGAGSGGTSAAGGTSANGGMNATGGSGATIPNQSGNPLTSIVNSYTSWLSTASGDAAKLAADRALADNMITWQMPHGGWFKYGKAGYASAWNGSEPRADWTGANGVELGTIDNGGTVTEIMFLADVYRRSSEAKYRDSVRKGVDFILTMQYASGGFPQVYPARPNSYSNYVTFNDDAMVRVLGMLDLAVHQKAPFGAETLSSAQLGKISGAISRAIDYILKAQIQQGGVRTVWCAQHDPNTYAAMGARSYELPSKSGKESVGVIGFLLSQPQTPEVKAAAQAAIAWYKSGAVKVIDTAYVSRPSGSTDDMYNPIQSKVGSTMWYRFYDLDKDTGFFSGRLPTDNPPGVGKKYNIMEIEAERRYGYQWGGSYGTGLFAYTDKIGY